MRTPLGGLLALAMLAVPQPSLATTTTVLREVGFSAALIGGAFMLDHAVHPGFPDSGPSGAAEEPGEFTGSAPVVFGGTAALAVGGLAFHNPGTVRTARDLAAALALTSVGVWALKLTTHRERPDGSNAYSFPSGHSATAFAAATVLDRRYGGLVGWAAYGAAALAAEARVADSHHYLSDVVAGAILGHFIGRFVTRHE
jgi:membrane-associated phospholipid phosphatase